MCGSKVVRWESGTNRHVLVLPHITSRSDALSSTTTTTSTALHSPGAPDISPARPLMCAHAAGSTCPRFSMCQEVMARGHSGPHAPQPPCATPAATTACAGMQLGRTLMRPTSATAAGSASQHAAGITPSAVLEPQSSGSTVTCRTAVQSSTASCSTASWGDLDQGTETEGQMGPQAAWIDALRGHEQWPPAYGVVLLWNLTHCTKVRGERVGRRAHWWLAHV